MTDVLLENRDYTVIIAKTATNMIHPPPGFEQRWIEAKSAIITLAQACEQLDPDGITIYISSATQGPFRHYQQVQSNAIEQIFEENYPPDELELLDALQKALDDYFNRKAANQTKANGAIILVLIDGEPKDRPAVVKAVVEATEKMDRDEELGIGFAQVGDDLIVRGFLTALDDDLRSRAGATYDIVHTTTLAAIAPTSLTQFLADIIRD